MSKATASITPPALIDAAEFARLLSVSKPTIWRLRDDGKLPPAIALTSQCIRWRREIVLDWIQAGCPAPNATDSQSSQFQNERPAA